jgi:tetratricopeptide (TPR) repeat protein
MPEGPGAERAEQSSPAPAAHRLAGDEAEAAPLVGRDEHLAALEEAFVAARDLRAVTMLVHGASGMGTTALTRRALATFAARGALVLAGRCHERGGMPYEALDAPVRALADFVTSLSRDEASALLPADVSALATLFPVLRGSPGVAAIVEPPTFADPLEARRRAGLALRCLLARTAAIVPVVLAIADLHAGDADSTSLLLDVLAPPDAPELLFLATYRDEDATSVDLVTTLRRRMAAGEQVGDVRELWVGPLGDRDARSLAASLLGAVLMDAADLEDAPDLGAIARASGGNPFVVHELARFVRAEAHGAGDLSIEAALRHRIDRLPDAPRRLLEMAALAGRPLAVDVLERAAAVVGAGSLAVLRAERLVLTRSADTGRVVVLAHARIGAAASDRRTPEARRRDNLALAAALEAAGGADPESLLVHLEAGGDAARARGFAEVAARRADRALAWGRAATLYRRALEGAPDPEPLRVDLATALERSGRCAEAGRVLLEAASHASARPAEALDLRRRAAELFLRAGHVDEGTAALREVLAGVGLSLPASSARSAASLAYRRAWLSVRGIGFTERTTGHAATELARVDACWSAGNGLHDVHPVRSADFRARCLLHALAAGEPVRVARALAQEVILAAREGGAGGSSRVAELVARAREVAERTGDANAIAWAAHARATAAFHEQRFADAAPLAELAIALFRAAGPDAARGVGSLIGWTLLPALWLLGRVEALSRALPAYLKEAEDLGALHEVTSLRTLTLPRLRLAEDRPYDARRESVEAIARWSSREGVTAPHYGDLHARVHAALYVGDGALAREELERTIKDLDRSFVPRVEVLRVDLTYLRGTVAVAAASPGPEGVRMLRVAERAARALSRERRPYAHAFSAALGASIARERGELERAGALFEQAERGFDALAMGLHASAVRNRRGELLRGEEGHELVDAADAFLREQGVVRPDRLVAMLAPTRTA